MDNALDRWLTDHAGFGFCSCAHAPPLSPGGGGPRPERRKVVVNGQRMLIVDIHGHSYVHDVWPLIKDYEQAQGLAGEVLSTPLKHKLSSIKDRLAAMDRAGIDVQAVSLHVGQYHYWTERELAAEIVRIQNEKLAEVVAAHADRFVGLGAVALHHPDLAAEQIEHGVKHLDLRGFMITASVNGEEICASRFEPFWKKAEELGTLIFIHPRGFAEGAARLRGPGRLDNLIGNPLETTVALSHMIFGGFLDRHPGLRIVAAHGGGYLPSYIGRSDKGHAWDPRCQQMKKKPSAYLRDLYFDTLVYSRENLEHLIRVVGADRLVLGTDYPFGMADSDPVDAVLALDTLSDDAREAILGATAARLLGLDPAGSTATA